VPPLNVVGTPRGCMRSSGQSAHRYPIPHVWYVSESRGASDPGAP